MAIARRKAGTVVRCPTCGGQVIVPQPEPAHKPGKEAGAVFEQANFDQVFEQPGNGPEVHGGHPPAPQPPAHPPAHPPHPTNVDVEPLDMGVEAEGWVLTTGKLILLGIIIILLMGLAFVAGLLVGRS